jgi:hypothetical protein
VRKVGIVCLDARLEPLRVRLRSVRKRTTPEAKLDAMYEELGMAARRYGAATLVLEAGSPRRGGTSFLAALGARGTELGFEVVRLDVSDACARVGEGPTLFSAAERLATRYDAVAHRILDAHGRLLRSVGRWREIRPLVVAFVLAYAIYAQAIVRAFGGAERSDLNPTHHPPPEYASRSSHPP